MILDFQARLAAAVKDAVRRELGGDLADVSFQYPPKPEMGDLALTAPFDLAKQLRRKPREIAETLAGPLGTLPGVVRAEVAGGGYVNLFLARGEFAGDMLASVAARAQRPAATHVHV